MAGISNYVAQGVLNHITGKSAIFSLPTVYLALMTTMPVADGTGGVEVSGGSYARIATTGDWGSPSGSPEAISNTTQINFPTATLDWGTVVGFAVYDALTNGNLLWYGTLSGGNQSVPKGVTPYFAIGNLSSSLQ